MVIIPPSSSALQLSSSNPLFSPPNKPVFSPPKPILHSFTTRASTDPPESPPESPPDSSPDSDSSTDQFDTRLSQLRIRYKSGTGKKAELRKSRKPTPKKNSTGAGGVFLPPVPLKEPVSKGLKVDFGFCPYSERINGRIAILGLTALLLVELATGKSVLRYHSPAIVFIQLYFVAAVSTLFVKYEKEKVSVWPQSTSKTS